MASCECEQCYRYDVIHVSRRVFVVSRDGRKASVCGFACGRVSRKTIDHSVYTIGPVFSFEFGLYETRDVRSRVLHALLVHVISIKRDGAFNRQFPPKHA